MKRESDCRIITKGKFYSATISTTGYDAEHGVIVSQHRFRINTSVTATIPIHPGFHGKGIQLTDRNAGWNSSVLAAAIEIESVVLSDRNCREGKAVQKTDQLSHSSNDGLVKVILNGIQY